MLDIPEKLVKLRTQLPENGNPNVISRTGKFLRLLLGRMSICHKSNATLGRGTIVTNKLVFSEIAVKKSDHTLI